MDARSSLSEGQRAAAVALFECGFGARKVAARFGVGRGAVALLYDRWRVRGRGALVDGKPSRRSYSFECKLEVVRRHLNGEARVDLAREFTLSSPKLVESWVRRYRAEGEDGLRPKRAGRPPKPVETGPRQVDELERLRRENEVLRAQVAYLGKVQALRARERP
ncbi:transposase [Rhodococcus sp. NPDC003318]|uniref:transposase n=1 Tax=Rhodococcus sp. NPDC003318 TaxID=3364503 RepID=UPI003681A240